MASTLGKQQSEQSSIKAIPVRRGLLTRLQAGLLRPWPSRPEARVVMSHYRRASALVRLEQELRLRICPFEEVMRLAPRRGVVLDLGCGFGVLAHLLAMESPERRVIGIEQRAFRVAVARQAAASHGGNVSEDNLRFIQGDIHETDFGLADCIVMNDVLHHIPHDRQIPLLKKCYSSLAAGGLLIIKDVTKAPLAKYIWNYIHDFLRNGNLPFYCLDSAILIAILELVGFQVTVTALGKGYPYPHVLYRCAKS